MKNLGRKYGSKNLISGGHGFTFLYTGEKKKKKNQWFKI